MKVKVYQFVALTLVALVLGTAASLVFSTSYTPAYAQAEDGILNDLGEGENRVLGTEWRTLQPGQQITFQFDYDGRDEPITVWMNAVPADGATFDIWTDSRLEDLSEDADTEPVGRGTAMAEGSGFTNWQGGSLEAETYYVVVSATGNAAARFLLNISSPALALVQPGAVALDADDSTSSLDPDIAVVTSEALNVRSGPSTSFAILTTVPNGTELTVLGRNSANTWLNVALEDGTEGWVTRSLTNYTLLSENIIASAQLPGAAASVATSVTGTTTTTATATITETGTAITSTTPITATAAVSATELGNRWQVLGPGEVDWYMLQYRGGELPLTIWMDLDPFEDAVFTVMNARSAQAMMAGDALPANAVIGRGRANPVEPGYLYWQSEFAEADTFYIMVEASDSAEGDVLYSINALGPGVGRVIEPVE